MPEELTDSRGVAGMARELWPADAVAAPNNGHPRSPARKQQFLRHFNDFVHCTLAQWGQLAGPKVTYAPMPAACPSDLHDPAVASGQVCLSLQGDVPTDTWAVSCDTHAQVPHLTKTAVHLLMTCLTDVRSP